MMSILISPNKKRSFLFGLINLIILLSLSIKFVRLLLGCLSIHSTFYSTKDKKEERNHQNHIK